VKSRWLLAQVAKQLLGVLLNAANPERSFFRARANDHAVSDEPGGCPENKNAVNCSRLQGANLNGGGLYRLLCVNSESNVVYAFASIGTYYSSIALFFPRLRRPARAAGVGDGSLFAPCAVIAPHSGSLAPVCSTMSRFIGLQ
jgi:hypothetical protein